jgi:hypothetical protein
VDDRCSIHDTGGEGISFLFATASRPALGSTQTPIQCVVRRVIYPGVNPSAREADHSPPSNVEVIRMRGDIPPLPNTSAWRGA